MIIHDTDLFMGICFLLSSYSKDDSPEGCVVCRGRRIISSGYSCKSLLGSLEGSSEKFAFSLFNSSYSPSNCNVYLDHTPSSEVLYFLSQFSFNKLVYFDTQPLDTQEAIEVQARVVKFSGNLNWMRDRMSLLKGFDIFG